MPDPIDWPAALRPNAVRFDLAGQTRGGGRTIAGTEQVVENPGGGYWTGSVRLQMRGDATILALRALKAQLRGRAGRVLVPVFDGRRAPWRVDPLFAGEVTPANGDPGNAELAPGLSFELRDPAALNATFLAVRRNRGGTLQAGQYLSLDGSLHLIVSIDGVDDGMEGDVRGVHVTPWPRTSYPVGTVVEMANPLCLCRFAKDDTAPLELELLRFGTTTVELVEAF